MKTASDEGLDSKKAKDGDLSFEFENLNLLNNELKVDMPKSSEELATSDNSNAIIENNGKLVCLFIVLISSLCYLLSATASWKFVHICDGFPVCMIWLQLACYCLTN